MKERKKGQLNVHAVENVFLFIINLCIGKPREILFWGGISGNNDNAIRRYKICRHKYAW